MHLKIGKTHFLESQWLPMGNLTEFSSLYGQFGQDEPFLLQLKVFKPGSLGSICI